MDIIKELNDFENLLKINDSSRNLERNKDKREKNEITKINEIKKMNIKIYQRNNKTLKEISDKSLNINDTNKELIQNIKKMYLSTLNYILPEFDSTQKEKGVNINSKIISKEKDFKLIHDYLTSLYNKKIKYKLIFRASEDGAFGKIFKKKCSKSKRTITIILTKNNRGFGGFTEVLWDNSDSTFKDKKAFCFSFDKNKIYKSIPDSNAIYCKDGYGPIFYDMFTVYKNFASEGGFCKVKGLAEMKYENVSMDYELAGEENFHIKELEVYEIIIE